MRVLCILAGSALFVGLVTTMIDSRAETTCDRPGLSNPTTCAGPWQYKTYVDPCFASKATKACGAPTGYEKKTVTVYPSCRTEANGLDYREYRNVDYWEHGEFKDEQFCDENRKPPCTIEQVCSFEHTRCDGRAHYEREVPPAYRGGTSYTDHQLDADLVDCHLECRARIKNAPVFIDAPNPACGAGHEEQVDDPARPIYPTCRHPSHGPAPKECGIEPAQKYSGFGLTSAALAQQVPLVAPNAVCTSCDLETGDPKSLEKCLKKQAGLVSSMPVDRPRLETILVEKRKVLFEMFADQLAGLADLQALYVSKPDALPACRSNPELPAVPAGCNARATYERARLCQRLLLGHVSEASAAVSYDLCASVGAEIKALPAACQPDPLATIYITNFTALTQRLLKKVESESGLPTIASLRAKLGVIERWHRIVRPFADASAAFNTQMLSSMQQLVAQLWDASRTAGALSPGATRDMIAARAIEIDRLVVVAAVGSDLPAPEITGAPLLYVIGRSFEGISDRVRAVTAFSDLGCLLQTCGAGGASSELAELWRLWSVIGNPDGTKTALASTSRVRKPWRDVFVGLDKHAARIQEAVMAASRANAVVDLAATDPAKLFEFSHPLASLAREGLARWTSFSRIGSLELHPRTVLQGGLASQQITTLESELNNRLGALRATLDDFTKNETTYLNSLLAELQNQTKTEGANAQLIAWHTQFKNLTFDLAGLRESARIETAQFADFVTVFVAAAKDQADKLIETTQTKVVIEAKHARTSAPSFDIAAVAANPGGAVWKRSIPKGSLAVIRTTGQWSPTCALKNYKMFNPKDPRNMAPIEAVGALTGPEGFLVQWNGSSYTATANKTSSEVTDHRSEGANGKACAGISISQGTPDLTEAFTGLELKVHASIEGCMTSEGGRSWADTTGTDASDGIDSRTNLSFATGLRMPGTPFPELAVGSLVAIKTPRGSTKRIESTLIPLVGPATEILVTEDSDLYFAVNDAPCASTGALTVTIDEAQLVGAVAEKVAKAMDSVLATLRLETQRVVNQGRILPNELAVLREAAQQTLRQQVPNVDSLPPVLRGMFETWVDVELLAIQRAVEVVSIERAMLLLQQDSNATKAAVAVFDGEKRIIEEMTRSALVTLDANRLSRDIGRVVQFLRDYMHPALDLRYPAVLDEMAKDHTVLDKFSNLVALDFMRSATDLSRDALDVADTIKKQWDAKKLNTIGNENVGLPVVVSFPKPGTKVDSWWAKADPTRSKKAWDALLDPTAKELTLDIRPEDVYSTTGGASRLQCTESTPIIRAMGLFFAIGSQAEGDAINLGGWRLPAQVDGQLQFTTALGPKNYLLANGDWLSEQMVVLFGVSPNAASVFDTLGKKSLVANGLSPFSKYTIDIQQLRSIAAVKDATEIVVVFEIERQRVSAPGIRGVTACTKAAPPLGPSPLKKVKSIVDHKVPRVLPGLVKRKRSW